MSCASKAGLVRAAESLEARGEPRVLEEPHHLLRSQYATSRYTNAIRCNERFPAERVAWPPLEGTRGSAAGEPWR